MSTIIPLNSEELPENCFIFKHSTQCSISGAAAEQVRGYSWALPLYWVNVIEQRSLSNWIADKFGVEHESPQLLRVENGAVAGVLNHRAIVQSAFTDL